MSTDATVSDAVELTPAVATDAATAKPRKKHTYVDEKHIVQGKRLRLPSKSVSFEGQVRALIDAGVVTKHIVGTVQDSDLSPVHTYVQRNLAAECAICFKHRLRRLFSFFPLCLYIGPRPRLWTRRTCTMASACLMACSSTGTARFLLTRRTWVNT